MLPSASPPVSDVAGTTIGVQGGSWRGDVTRGGAIRGWNGEAILDWWIAADDRWHDPAVEPTVRQLRVDGTPVVETRVRVPNGDVIQRIYAVADRGGFTVIEIQNDSPLPVAVVVAGAPVCSVRPPSDLAMAAMPVGVVDLPPGAVSFPIGHHASITLAIAHTPGATGALPDGLASAAQVSRGWLARCDRASRLVLPDQSLIHAVVAERCELLLAGPVSAATPIELLLGVGELVRMGSPADWWMPEVAEAVAALAGHADDPALPAAIDAAERACRGAGERRAVRDLARVRVRLASAGRAPTNTSADKPARGARLVSWVERRIAAGPVLFPAGIPAEWFGIDFEAHHVPTSADAAVSLAVRWHGARPAVLWECEGPPGTLRAEVAAPGWSTSDAAGDALWPAPTSADYGTSFADDEPISFS